MAHNFARHISSANTGALAYRNNGQVFAFNQDGTNWQGDADIPDTLVAIVDTNNNRTGWLYATPKDTVEQYNAAGQLTQVTNRLGKTQSLIYDLATADGGDNNSATLDKVTGFAGDTMTFGYNTGTPYPERITSMTDPNGQTYRYAYDTADNLLSVSYPDDTPNNDKDNPTRLYHYENTTFPHHLTGITDKAGRRDINWVYDSQGRAISAELVADRHKSTIAYNADGSATVTTYQHNDQGQEISRTEAAGTTTTQWHVNFNMPARITEPGKVVEFKYDAQGRLTSQIIRSIP
ncbi:hypothetical protein MNBD_GAMMA26-235 [hydrothermal vent metagenome]|uniref:Rhs-family protein n=1 Tax=hydrothermal vent metagenome TaxID=652676 RepID=A0A3B1B3F4_9ZZZZ